MPRLSAGDRLLAVASAIPSPLRRRAARQAAGRGLHVPALRADPRDPFILNALGMHQAVLALDRPGDVERTIALAGLGRIDDARAGTADMDAWSLDDRRRLARAAAVSDIAWSLSLSPPTDHLALAACWLALGRPEKARPLIDAAPDDQERRFLKAAVSLANAAWSEGRRHLNTAFTAEMLAPVVDETLDAPIELGALGRPAPLLEGDRPQVSVIMAAKNAAATIEIALRSLGAQTWRQLDIVVVDDGSDDETVALIQAAAARDPRVRLLRNARRPGAYGARNTGIEAARGAFICFNDADDWAHPQRIERQMKGIAARGVAASVCRHVRLDGQSRLMSPRGFPLMRLNPILLLARRRVFEEWGAFEEVRLGADSELLARFDAALGRKAVARVATPCVIAAWSDRSLMGASGTGLSREGLRLRTAYVEEWRRRHARGQLAIHL